MTRPRGRALRGERLIAKVPNGHWKTTTFLAALRTSDSPRTGGGRGDQWGRVPSLRGAAVGSHTAQGDIVIMDNLNSHKVKGVREAIEVAVGALGVPAAIQSRLQPDRAGLCEVQMATAEQRVRSVEGLWALCGALLDRFTQPECELLPSLRIHATLIRTCALGQGVRLLEHGTPRCFSRYAATRSLRQRRSAENRAPAAAGRSARHN